MHLAITRAALACLAIVAAGGCGCSDTGLEGGPDGAGGDGTPTDGPGTTDAAWDPPVESMGEPGWRDSVDPVCREDESIYDPIGIWSDHRGVFVILQSHDGMGGAFIVWNDGSGWSEIGRASDPYGPMGLADRLAGFEDGDLMAYSNNDAMGVLSPPDWTFSTVDVHALHVHVVSEGLAYATLEREPRLMRYAGSSWGPFPGEPLPYAGRLVWADETSVFVAGDSGTILSHEDGSWTVHDTGTVEDFISIWGFAADDVWAGTAAGRVMHWDGLEWRTVEWPNLGDDSDACHRRASSIEGMWGIDGTLFFHSSKQLVMWDGAEFVTLGYWPGEEVEDDGIFFCDGRLVIRSIWGNSPTELFMAVEESERSPHLCEEYIMWWDGALFHWF